MVDPNEIDGAVKSTISQIEHAIEGTNLTITSTDLKLLECYSITASLANGGYSNDIDLQGMIIDPVADEQEFILPINRRFSNNEAYRIGYLKVVITDKDKKVVETEKAEVPSEKESNNLIVPIIIGTSLFIVLGFAVFLLIKMIRKRRFNKNHRNPTIL